jgi:hypothetical protein
MRSGFVLALWDSISTPFRHPTPLFMGNGYWHAHALNSVRFHFAGVILAGGLEVGLGMGLGFGGGPRVACDAVLHNADIISAPHWWSL